MRYTALLQANCLSRGAASQPTTAPNQRLQAPPTFTTILMPPAITKFITAIHVQHIAPYSTNRLIHLHHHLTSNHTVLRKPLFTCSTSHRKEPTRVTTCTSSDTYGKSSSSALERALESSRESSGDTAICSVSAGPFQHSAHVCTCGECSKGPADTAKLIRPKP
jgi:hypothetical protein